jgi:hypothetical protein
VRTTGDFGSDDSKESVGKDVRREEIQEEMEVDSRKAVHN